MRGARALYYPEWEIRDPAFLFESLLYWDIIGCIVPFADFDSHWTFDDPELTREWRELHKRYVYGFVPGNAVQKAVLTRLRTLLDREPPQRHRPENIDEKAIAYISGLKLGLELEEMLHSRGWTRRSRQHRDYDIYAVSPSVADLVLYALVEEMSTDTMPPMTREPDVFDATCKALLKRTGSAPGYRAGRGRPG